MVEKEESPNDIARALLGRIEELYSRCEKDEHGNVSFWVDESPVEDPGLTYEYNNRLNKERSRLTPEETCEIRKGLIAAGALPKGSRILQLELKIRQTVGERMSVLSVEFDIGKFRLSEESYPNVAKNARECLLAHSRYAIKGESGNVVCEGGSSKFDEVYVTGEVHVPSYAENIERTSNLPRRCYNEFRQMVESGARLNERMGIKFYKDSVDKGDLELLYKLISILSSILV